MLDTRSKKSKRVKSAEKYRVIGLLFGGGQNDCGVAQVDVWRHCSNDQRRDQSGLYELSAGSGLVRIMISSCGERR